MDTAQTVLKSARHFFAGTLLSRISGMLRDIAMAFSFGSSPEIAAFMVAYRLSYLFRRLIGEGNLQAGFVPQFEAARGRGEETLFYRDITASFSVALLGLIIVLEGLFWGMKTWISDPAWQEIIELSMWMIPGLFFISLYALNAAVLQCQKKYFFPAVAPVAFNFVWIAAALAVPSARFLSVAIIIAFAAQWLVTLDRKMPWRGARLFQDNFRSLLKPMGLGVIGIGAVQINSALDALFARVADVAGPTFLWYAIRVEQLPLALFGIALSGALLPPLTRALQQGDTSRYHALLQSAFRSSTALMLPCTFGIFALGLPGLNLLFGHGHFESDAVYETLHCLWAYALGLLPSVWVLLLAAGFYAQKSYQAPTRASLLSVVINVGLNALFVFAFRWGAVSIALATSASALFNALYLIFVLRSAVFDWMFFLKMAVCSGVPAILTALVSNLWIGNTLPRDLMTQLIQCMGLSSFYAGGLFGMAYWLKPAEFFQLFNRKITA